MSLCRVENICVIWLFLIVDDKCLHDCFWRYIVVSCYSALFFFFISCSSGASVSYCTTRQTFTSNVNSLVGLGLGIVQKFSIPIPWVRYRFLNDTFFDTNFMKSVLTRLHYLKKLCFYFFSACWHLYRLKDSSPEPLHKGTKYIHHNKSVQIIFNKVQIVFSLHIC